MKRWLLYCKTRDKPAMRIKMLVYGCKKKDPKFLKTKNS